MPLTDNRPIANPSHRNLLIGVSLIALVLALGLAWTLGRNTARDELRNSDAAVTPVQEPARDQNPQAAGRPAPQSRFTPGPIASAEQLAQQQTIFSTFETRFRQDTPDAKWAGPAEKALIEAASEPALTAFGTPESYDASCRGHMCKLSLSFATRIQAEDWSELYVVGMGGAVSHAKTMISPRPDGKAELIIFATRRGFEGLLQNPPDTAPTTAGPSQN